MIWKLGLSSCYRDGRGRVRQVHVEMMVWKDCPNNFVTTKSHITSLQRKKSRVESKLWIWISNWRILDCLDLLKKGRGVSHINTCSSNANEACLVSITTSQVSRVICLLSEWDYESNQHDCTSTSKLLFHSLQVTSLLSYKLCIYVSIKGKSLGSQLIVSMIGVRGRELVPLWFGESPLPYLWQTVLTWKQNSCSIQKK
jgi:hypothetical protein